MKELIVLVMHTVSILVFLGDKYSNFWIISQDCLLAGK